MNTLVEYPIPTEREAERTLLFGVILLMAVITIIYFIFNLGVESMMHLEAHPSPDEGVMQRQELV